MIDMLFAALLVLAGLFVFRAGEAPNDIQTGAMLFLAAWAVWFALQVQREKE